MGILKKKEMAHTPAVAALIVLCTPFCGASPHSSSPTTGCDCSSDRCTSPNPFGGADCWAGSRAEAFSCSAGSYYLTGSSTEHLGATYKQYTCCTGSHIHPSCYDTTMRRSTQDHTTKESCESEGYHWDEEDQKCHALDDTGNLIVGIVFFVILIACIAGIIGCICKCFNCGCFSGGQSTGVFPAQQGVAIQQPIQMGQQPVQMAQPYQTAQQPMQMAQQPMQKAQPYQVAQQPIQMAQQPIQMAQQPTQMAQPYQTAQQPMQMAQPYQVAQQPIQMAQQPMQMAQPYQTAQQPTQMGQPYQTAQ